MSELSKIIVIGANSAIAVHCMRLWLAKAPAEIVLVGRNVERLQAVAADLRVRNPAVVLRVLSGDFTQTDSIADLAGQAWGTQPAAIVLLAQGVLPPQQDCQSDLAVCRAVLDVNAVSAALFAEAFAAKMEAAGAGTLAVLGSVAGDRGRQSNYIYGAAKGLMERYVQGLQHRFAGTAIKVVLLKPGPTDTPMTAAFKQQGMKLAPVADVAEQIVRAINQGVAVAYVPGKWRLIMMIIRHLPRIVFNRMRI